MRLADSTLQRVRDLLPSDIIGHYLTLKTKNGKHQACCPFHDEKTPSFAVNDRKGIFKCFGCGAAGDGIQFVMLREKLDFRDAVEAIAQAHGITIERLAQDPAEAAADAELARRRQAVRLALEFAAAWFQANELPAKWAERRRLGEEVRLAFRVGAAPAAPRQLYEDAVRQGFSAEVLVEAGLVRQAQSAYYDVFQDRVMLPIRDVRGRVVAFTGRLVTEPAPDATYKPGKYLNSSDTVWVKGDHLYGLDTAAAEIAKKRHMYVVEGQLDVLQMWQAGLRNTVAIGTTKLTAAQLKLLTKHTTHIVLTPDHDAAGLEGLAANAEQLLRAGCRVEVLLPEKAKGSDKTDPDDYLRRKVHTATDLDGWLRQRQDYLTGYLLKEEEKAACAGPHERAEAIERLGAALEWVPNDTVRGSYYDTMAGLWPDFRKHYKLARRGHETTQRALQDLEAETRVAYYDQGYFAKNGSLYALAPNGKEIRICPFTLEVLYFIYSKEPKYVCSLRNIWGEGRSLAITTDDFASVGTFKKIVGRLGNFIFEGTDEHLNKIKIKEFNGVPQATQPRYMGWNPAGFMTWANGLYFDGQFVEADPYGIVTLRRPLPTPEQVRRLPANAHVAVAGKRRVVKSGAALIDELGADEVARLAEQGHLERLTYHYLPAAAALRLEDAGDADQIDENESFEADRLFVHFNQPGLTFAEWASLIRRAFGDNGIVMIAFYVAALFRDIIYEANSSYFPLLCHFGPPGTGKSKAAEALAGMFGRYQPDGINLEGGSTVIGIRRYMDNVQNGIIWLNEYKDTLPNPTLAMIKTIADGGGRLSGQKTGGNETKSTLTRSTAIVCGQDVPARDAAILTRCLINEFSEAGKDANDLSAYERLIELRHERKLTAVTCEVLGYRDAVMAYRKRVPAVQRELKEVCAKLIERRPDDRAILNVASVLTPLLLLEEAGLKLPFTLDEARTLMAARLKLQTQIQATTNDVEQYFGVVASMIGREVLESVHFKIQKETDGKTKLFLRVNQVHGAYLTAAQRQNKAALGSATVRGYLAQSRYFLEDRTKGVRFAEVANPTSAMVFDYELMRRTGIEFDTKQVIADLTEQDDPSAVQARVSQLRGDGLEDLRDFINEMQVGSTHRVSELADRFNARLDTPLSVARFVELVKEYIDAELVGPMLTFSGDGSRLRIDPPF